MMKITYVVNEVSIKCLSVGFTYDDLLEIAGWQMVKSYVVNSTTGWDAIEDTSMKWMIN